MCIRPLRGFLPSALLSLVLAPGVVFGQDAADGLRQEHRIPLPPTAEYAQRGSEISPGISITSPTGFGARWGDAFVGLAYQHRTRTFSRPDGGAAAGIGLGNPEQWIGLEAVVTTFGTVQSCCRGGASFKAHRRIGSRSSVAVGYENAILWGDGIRGRPATDAGQSLYVAGSRVFAVRPDGAYPFPTLTVTVGAGDGRFRREKDIVEDRSAVNVFGAASARLSSRSSLIADWTGRDLAAGMSIVPFHGRPFFVTPAVADLTSRPRFVIGAGLGFNYGGVPF